MPDLLPVPIQSQPYNAETPMAALAQAITPVAAFYVRNHFDAPILDASGYRLLVDLGNGAPLELSLADLQALPRHTVTLTLECAGNGRSVLDPPPPGVRWAFGAVGTAAFSGVPLRTLVELAGLREGTVELLFDGMDRGEVQPGREVSFARSLPLADALHPDTVLAWAMNGEPLPADHGYPLRLVAPRWYGVASVKWLREIRALDEPFRGYYQAEQYRYRRDAFVDEDTPVTTMRVKAVIASPADGAVLAGGPIEIRGLAWSGEAPVARVQLSLDDGASWFDAGLYQPPSLYAAAGWRALWSPGAPGDYTLMVRASDEAGNIQLLDPAWNEQGYGNNGVQRIAVRVAERVEP